MNQKVLDLAKHEIGWWKAHYRKNSEAFLEHMTQLYMSQFGIDKENAKIIVNYRIEATKFHDTAEQKEDAGEQKNANRDWDRAEKALQKHFELLEKHRKR